MKASIVLMIYTILFMFIFSSGIFLKNQIYFKNNIRRTPNKSKHSRRSENRSGIRTGGLQIPNKSKHSRRSENRSGIRTGRLRIPNKSKHSRRSENRSGVRTGRLRIPNKSKHSRRSEKKSCGKKSVWLTDESFRFLLQQMIFYFFPEFIPG